MKLNLEIEQGIHPELYATDLVRAMGIKSPPVDENEVAEFLGYSMKVISAEDTMNWPLLPDILKLSPTHLFKKENLIVINGEMPRLRKRLSIFHEFGHELLPWHNGLNYSCTENLCEVTFHKMIEREAFSCGSEVMMPRHLFVPDIRSLPTGSDAIRKLATRYVSSLEATAIRYVGLHPQICALLVAEPNSNHRRVESSESIHPQLSLPIRVNRSDKKHNSSDYPLKVRYFVKSRRFDAFVRPGIGITPENPVFEAWATGFPSTGLLTSSAFGFVNHWACNVDCRPLPGGNAVFALLSAPDGQNGLMGLKGEIL